MRPTHTIQPALSALQIFQQGSTTYFTASLFFSRHIREKVTTLYAFVRVADNYVDQVPQDSAGFENFYAVYHSALAGKSCDNRVITEFIQLQKSIGIKQEWVEAFFDAMRSDLYTTRYTSITELETYMYGSAEVIGLMMSQILGLPEVAHQPARLLGKAMQYINFLRDVQEDISLKRQYLPSQELAAFGLKELSESAARKHPVEFLSFVRMQTELSLQWLVAAEGGMQYIPWRERVAIQTAAAMYRWTAEKIAEDPYVIFTKKVKPHKAFIIMSALKNVVKHP